VRFLLRCYEIDDQVAVVRRAVFMRPKGRAKMELGTAIACAEALGPVRFAGWDADGKPVGLPVASPFVRLAATEEGQAGNTYEAVRVMLTEGPLSRAGLDVGLTRTFLPGGGKILPVTAAAASKEGGKETFAVFDETGLYTLTECTECTRRSAEPREAESCRAVVVGDDDDVRGRVPYGDPGRVDLPQAATHVPRSAAPVAPAAPIPASPHPRRHSPLVRSPAYGCVA
jgi:hypothetical protein